MPRVLVVDDEPLICDVIADCLEHDGTARVDCAYNGLDGRKLIRGYQYSLAVIDAVLPGLDGFTLAEHATNENTPVLLMSGHPTACEQLEQFDFPHLTKPFDLDVLLSEARGAMEAMRENIRRAQASAAEMRAHMERLAAAVEESRRLRAESMAKRTTDR